MSTMPTMLKTLFGVDPAALQGSIESLLGSIRDGIASNNAEILALRQEIAELRNMIRSQQTGAIAIPVIAHDPAFAHAPDILDTASINSQNHPIPANVPDII